MPRQIPSVSLQREHLHTFLCSVNTLTHSYTIHFICLGTGSQYGAVQTYNNAEPYIQASYVESTQAFEVIVDSTLVDLDLD